MNADDVTVSTMWGQGGNTTATRSNDSVRYIRIPAEFNMLEETLEIVHARAGAASVRRDGADWVIEVG